MTLESLRPSQRFRIPFLNREGTLLRVGLMGCVVRYDGATRRRIETEESVVEFDAPSGPTMIAGATEVEPLAATEGI